MTSRGRELGLVLHSELRFTTILYFHPPTTFTVLIAERHNGLVDHAKNAIASWFYFKRAILSSFDWNLP